MPLLAGSFPSPPPSTTPTITTTTSSSPRACRPSLQAALDAETARRHALERQLASLVAEVGEAAGLEATGQSKVGAQVDGTPPAEGAPAPPHNGVAAEAEAEETDVAPQRQTDGKTPAATVSPTDASGAADASSAAPSAAVAAAAAQFGSLLARLRVQYAAQAARDEEQRFALDLAHREKGVLQSRAMLGRRHRAPSAAGASGGTSGASPVGGGSTAALAAPAAKVDSVLNKENAGAVLT